MYTTYAYPHAPATPPSRAVSSSPQVGPTIGKLAAELTTAPAKFLDVDRGEGKTERRWEFVEKERDSDENYLRLPCGLPDCPIW